MSPRSPVSLGFLIPDGLDVRIVAAAAIAAGLARTPLDPREVEVRRRDLVYEGTIAL